MIKASDLEGYVSPVEVTYQNALKSIKEKSDDAIHYAIEAELGVKVDREELLKALRYDRDQYEKGYGAGYYARDREIVRCGDCKIYGTGGLCDLLFMPDDYCSKGDRK